MNINKLINLIPVVTLALFIGSANAEPAGIVDLLDGSATRTDITGAKTSLRQNGNIEEGDTIETAADSELHIKMNDAGFFSVRPNTRIKIDQFQANGTDTDVSVVSILKGALRSITGFVGKVNPGAVKFHTATATIGIRGTDHEIIYIPEDEANADQPAGTHHIVYEGKTTFENDQGLLDVTAGQSAFSDHLGRIPRLNAVLPDFIKRRQLRHESRITEYNREVLKHIEHKLHERHLIRPEERFEHFLKHRQMRQNLKGMDNQLLARRNPVTAQTEKMNVREERRSGRKAEREKRRGD